MPDVKFNNIFLKFFIQFMFTKISVKGQLISKCLFGVFNSPKKRLKTIRLEEVVKSNFLVRFLGELKIPKRYFEIN